MPSGLSSGRNVYSVLEQKTPKTLLIGEGRNIENPKDLMGFILNSFSSFSLSHEDTDIIIIDPITGDKVTVTNNDGEWKIDVEPQEYEFPYCDSVDFNNILIPREKVRSSEISENHVSKEEKSLEKFLHSEMRNENEPEKEKEVDSSISVSGPLPLRGPIITFMEKTEPDIDISRISEIRMQHPAYKGWCDGCKEKTVIRHRAETFDGGVYALCEDCYRSVLKKLRERDEA